MPWDNPEDLRQMVAQPISPRTSKRRPWSSPANSTSASPTPQGLELFTALQMQKVPSKLLLFPDEGHWILKPQKQHLVVQDIPRLDWELDKTVKVIIRRFWCCCSIGAPSLLYVSSKPAVDHGRSRESDRL